MKRLFFYKLFILAGLVAIIPPAGAVQVSKKNLPKIIPRVLNLDSIFLATGFFVEKDIVVTRYRVLGAAFKFQGMRFVNVEVNGKTLSGAIVLADWMDDIAIIKIKEEAGIPLELGKYSDKGSLNSPILFAHTGRWISGFVEVFLTLKKEDMFKLSGKKYDYFNGAPVLSKDLKAVGVVRGVRDNYIYGLPIHNLKWRLYQLYAHGGGVQSRPARSVKINFEKAKYWYNQWLLDFGNKNTEKNQKMRISAERRLKKLQGEALRREAEGSLPQKPARLDRREFEKARPGEAKPLRRVEPQGLPQEDADAPRKEDFLN